jgi:hypothetical protein
MLLFAVAVLAAGALIARSVNPEPYAPLGNYSVQQVGYEGFLTDRDGKAVNPPPKQLLPTSIFPGDLEPLPTLTVETGLETLPVHAEKCIDADVPVQVVGNVRWRNLAPPGAIIQGSRGSVTRQPGCETFDYKRPLPLEVYQRLQVLAAEGIRESKWQVQGDETPTETPLSVTKYWESTEFIIKYVGPEALEASTSTTQAPSVPVNPFPDAE